VASTSGQHLLEGCALEPPVVLLAVQREDLGERQAGRLLDAPVQLHEGHVQAPGQAPSDRGLAGAAQPQQRDQGQGGLARRLGQQRRGCRAQGAGQSRQLAHGDVPRAGLDR
jgi:hypothetical protein